jgi:hypothetical protein
MSDETKVPAHIGCRVDDDLRADLLVIQAADMSWSDAIKYGIAALAMKLRSGDKESSG